MSCTWYLAIIQARNISKLSKILLTEAARDMGSAHFLMIFTKTNNYSIIHSQLKGQVENYAK